MIEPPQSATQPSLRGNRLPDRDADWGLNGDARINRAARLAIDLQQILAFADREYSRPDEPRPKDAKSNNAERRSDRPVESPLAAEVHRRIENALDSIQLESTHPEETPIPFPHMAAWRQGLVRRGPWLVSAALCALIAIDLARASMTLFFGGLPRAALPTDAIVTRAPARPAVDVRSIVAAQLFGVFAADPGSQDPSGTPQVADHLLLAGTLATENPKTGLAIISDTGPAEVYKVGASVGSASLQSVYRDRVILSRNGRLETLALPKPSSSKGKPAAAAPAAPYIAESDDPANVDAGKGRTAADIMRTSATLRPDGKLRGFRIYPNGNRTAFDKSGLRGGDLLVAVNGTSLQDQDRKTGQEMLNTMAASGTATLTIERNGERRDVTVYAPDDSSPSD
jgi:general secretion pathway protein C